MHAVRRPCHIRAVPVHMISKLLILRGYSCTISVAMGEKRQGPRVELPTAGELRLLQVLWRIHEGTIEDIVMASGEDHLQITKLFKLGCGSWSASGKWITNKRAVRLCSAH